MTAWASPGVVTDETRPELGAVAVVTVSFALYAYTSNEPRSEPHDLLLGNLLGRGFALLGNYTAAAVAELPLVDGWSCRITTGHVGGVDGLEVRIGTASEVFYTGDLGRVAPAGWLDAATRRGHVAVLAATGVDLHAVDRTARIQQAQRAGLVVAGQVRTDVGRTGGRRW